MPRPGHLLLLTVAALLPAAAAAETPLTGRSMPCSDCREVKRQLGARYDEAPVSLGLQSNGNVLQVFASARTGSWTIVSTSPAGLACILAAGRAWDSMPQPSPGPAA